MKQQHEQHVMYAQHVMDRCKLRFELGDLQGATRLHHLLERLEEMTDEAFDSPLIHSVATPRATAMVVGDSTPKSRRTRRTE